MPNNNGLLTDINVLMAEFRPYRTLKDDNRKLLLYYCISMRLVLEQYCSEKIILCNTIFEMHNYYRLSYKLKQNTLYL